ncbi:MAG: phosphoribosylformylglycinamidine cyclo-ligase [Abditibacteriota bacterium]|nr:phosphoribosylformylglycinamidine cyclo-ligase [Abditibacteriota bacterium]
MADNSTYKAAGVDIDAGTEAVNRLKEYVRSTYTPDVASDVGGFGGMIRVPQSGMTDPILVSSIDGVGTKVKIAAMMNKYDTVGMDIVNHSVNDILVQGAKALFFLDYFATSALKPAMAADIVKGMSAACREVGCALIGGEIAEMPGVYVSGEFDIAGCIVGIVDRPKIIDGSKVRPGDVVLGLKSSGPHTNGYSLIRKIFFDDNSFKVTDEIDELGCTLGEALLAPHRCYGNPIHKLIPEVEIHAMAHLTGGGFYNNIPRVLPEGCGMEIDNGSWDVLPIFKLIGKTANIDFFEMHRTFNMGIGMVVVVSPEDADKAAEILRANGETVYRIGKVVSGPREVVIK